MILQRFRRDELSLKRVFEAVNRRISDVPHSVIWYLPSKNNQFNSKNLSRYSNIHSKDRCFIIGNGPSLKKTDLSYLKKEITFGLNRIYLLFDEIPFKPTYYVASNELVLEQFASDIQKLEMPKFLNWNRRSYFRRDDENTMFFKLNFTFQDYFGKDPRKPLCGGGTVTYIAMQLAYYMGFREVILIGVDHNFAEKGTPNTTEVRQSDQDKSHFHPAYFPKGYKWQLPDLKRSELSYLLAKKGFEEANRAILDATVEGKCQIFHKVDYSSLFWNGK